jgi:hypothetical protein
MPHNAPTSQVTPVKADELFKALAPLPTADAVIEFRAVFARASRLDFSPTGGRLSAFLIPAHLAQKKRRQSFARPAAAKV